MAKTTYESNPFKLSFNAFGFLSSNNVSWMIALIVFDLLNLVSNLTNGPSGSIETSSTTTGSATPAIVIALMVLAGSLAVLTFLVFFTGMFSYVALKSLDGKKVGLKEAFKETRSKFWLLAVSLLAAGVRIIGGLFLFIVPGIRALLRYSIVPFIIMSGEKNVTRQSEVIERSKALTKYRLMEVFGVMTVSTLIPFIGSSLSFSGEAALYRQMATYHDKNLEKPEVHWLNYIGFIISAAVLILLALLALAIFAGSA